MDEGIKIKTERAFLLRKENFGKENENWKFNLFEGCIFERIRN